MNPSAPRRGLEPESTTTDNWQTQRPHRVTAQSRREINVPSAGHSGQAHPRDEESKHLIQQWAQLATRAEAWTHVAFLDDYDMRLATELVQEVDVRINMRRPWEASAFAIASPSPDPPP